MNKIGFFLLLVICSLGIVFLGVYERNLPLKTKISIKEHESSIPKAPLGIPEIPISEPVAKLTIPPDTLIIRFLSRFSSSEKVWEKSNLEKMVKPKLFSSHKKRITKNNIEEADYYISLKSGHPLSICQWELSKEISRYGGQIIYSKEFRNYQTGKSTIYVKIKIKETTRVIRLSGVST